MPTIGELYMPDIGASFNSGWDRGVEQRRKSTLADFMQQASSGDQSALAKVYGVDPDAGRVAQAGFVAQQKRQQEQQDEMRVRVGRHAAVLAKLPPAYQKQYYEGTAYNDLKGAFPDLQPQWSEEYAAALPQISEALAGDDPATAQERSFANMTQGMAPDDIAKARRIHLGLDPRAGYTPIQTADGYGVFDRQNATVAPLNYGGPRATMEPTGPASQGGYTIDPSLPPQVQAEIRAREGGAPRPWTVNTSSPYGDATPQRVMPAPKAGDGPSALQERLEYARRMGATPDELRQMVIGKEGAAAGAKPMPPAALKMIQEETNAANTAATINASLDKHLGRIESGKLDFGPLDNQINSARNFVGMSSPESRNFAEFKSDLEKLRNDSLRLNAGVQTDGDAQRAWNELFANINDTKYVKQRLQTIKALNDRARSLRQLNADMIRENYGRGGEQATAPAASGFRILPD